MEKMWGVGMMSDKKKTSSAQSEAAEFLISVMKDESVDIKDRMKAAESIRKGVLPAQNNKTVINIIREYDE